MFTFLLFERNKIWGQCGVWIANVINIGEGRNNLFEKRGEGSSKMLNWLLGEGQIIIELTDGREVSQINPALPYLYLNV